jgi:hypothetical protein
VIGVAVEAEVVAPPGDAPARVDRGVVDGLLIEPQVVLEQALAAPAAAQAAMVRTMLLAILVGTGIFGAAVGFYRGGAQVLFAAIKLPFVVLLTAALAAPALTALGAALGRPARLRPDLVRVLASLARGSLMLAALAPVMLVAICVQLDYRHSVMLLVGCCAGAGATGLPLLMRGLWKERRGRLFLTAAMLVVVSMAGTHTSWLFRPYLVRPETTVIPFLRGIDGSFSGAVGESFEVLP